MNLRLSILSTAIILLYACSPAKQIERSAKKNVLADSSLHAAHVGISVFDPSTGKYLYNYQGDKYFVPASNTKIPTCYAAMKYLGDSLVGLRYGFSEPDSLLLVIQPTGDPTFLHPDFKQQSVLNFLSSKVRKYKDAIGILDTIWRDEKWGSGWSWNDYDASYMAERSSMPIFGNVLDVKINALNKREITDIKHPQQGSVKLFTTQTKYFDSMLNDQPYLISRENLLADNPKLNIKRHLDNNSFSFEESNRTFQNRAIPFVADGSQTATFIISDSLGLRFGSLSPYKNDSTFYYTCPDCRVRSVVIKNWKDIHSQPTDSLLKPMMHNSDNFFAEQSLLMVSNEVLGVMNDGKIIDSLLKTDFKNLPQRPRWADGSGLSRYNLFTPQDFIAILNKMQNEFGMERIKTILPTGNEGTLEDYYKSEAGYIFAKTGTLSGVIALSGFIYTKKNKLLIFSILVNNHQASATEVRRTLEKFVRSLREKN